MEQQERIQIRNKLFKELKELRVIVNSKNNSVQIRKNRLFNNINNNSELKEEYNLYISEFRSEGEALYCLLHNDDFENHRCIICNNLCIFHHNPLIYRRTCGDKKCINKLCNSEKSKEKAKKTKLERYGIENYNNIEKAKKTNLERYGYEYAMQSKEVQEKSKRTNLERRGVEYSMQSKEVQEKSKRTNLERRGVEYPMQSKEVQEKSKETVRERYGVDNVFQSKEIQEKIRNTMIERYGVEHTSYCKKFIEKSKQTCLERYGVENPFQCEEFKEKGRKTCLKKYGVENASQNLQIINKIRKTNLKKYNVEIATQRNIKNYDIWINDNKFKNFIIDQYNKKKSFLLLNDINGFFNVLPDTIRKKAEKLNLLNYFYIQDSYMEVNFDKFLNENNIEHKRRSRKLYDSKSQGYKEIDFLCEDKNIGFEINDIASHYSNIIGYYPAKDKYYHRNKTILAKEYNIRLIHIWEWEIRNKNEWERLSRWIINICNNNKIKIGARKCLIRKISEDIEKEFLNNYHLQGYKKSEVCYGLYYNNQLIQIMSFTKPRYNKNYQWELLRLCTKYGYTIIGGAQKLLKNFIKDNNPNSIISYCNLDKFTGEIYEQMGFKLLRNIEPKITWCNKHMKHFTQSSLNMIGADKMIGTNYGKGTNNEEIIINHGYVPIYNCGINVYLLEKEIEK